MTIRVTVEDLATGETDSAEVTDDYIVICEGSCYVAHTNTYPQKGTHVLTIKGRRDSGSVRASRDNDRTH